MQANCNKCDVLCGVHSIFTYSRMCDARVSVVVDMLLAYCLINFAVTSVYYRKHFFQHYTLEKKNISVSDNMHPDIPTLHKATRTNY